MASTSRLATPITPEMTVREARDLYFCESGFSLALYNEATFAVPVGPLSVQLPNPPERRRVVSAHDLHHVLCGYGTDWIGVTVNSSSKAFFPALMFFTSDFFWSSLCTSSKDFGFKRASAKRQFLAST
jgi:hypothetical protein